MLRIRRDITGLALLLGSLFQDLAADANELTCYQRDYSDQHLTANKNQTVKMLRVGLPRYRTDQDSTD